MADAFMMRYFGKATQDECEWTQLKDGGVLIGDDTTLTDESLIGKTQFLLLTDREGTSSCRTISAICALFYDGNRFVVMRFAYKTTFELWYVQVVNEVDGTFDSTTGTITLNVNADDMRFIGGYIGFGRGEVNT